MTSVHRTCTTRTQRVHRQRALHRDLRQIAANWPPAIAGRNPLALAMHGAAIFLLASLLPISSALAADLAFITSQNGNAVSILDLKSHEIVAQTPVDGAPAPVAYDPKTGRAYVISADTGRLSVLDEKARIIDRRELGEGAFGVAVAPNGGVFVTDWFNGKLMRLDGELKQVWIAETGTAPAGVAVSHDGLLVATADRDDNQVSIFDSGTGRLIRRIKTAGEHPFAVTFHGGRLWTADVMGDAMSVIDPIGGKLVGQIETGSHPYGIAFAEGRGFVTNQYDSTLTVFDPESLEVLGEVETGDYPEGIAPLPDGSGIVVANWDSDTVTVVDAKKLEATAEIEMPAGPRAFGQFTGRQVEP
ncbi:40-residue YVTN family beta-propeller repeat-containing protein [Paracoccus saliphilus]|uniref:40-residue YVTN family beta-propeller repeat-containing protein n=1 Tax=Paracoccus saliphilus TaxID=405559 RepID=A0AA45W0J5_9RHOB|nr:40-residue YVTN family beta-propeller repeat-containing protein [Paracoccus saliphilus]